MSPLQSRVNFTPGASIKMKEYLAQEEGKGLRIFLENGQYVLGLDHPDANDTVIDYDGFRLLIDPKSIKYVTGLMVDYIGDGEGGTFELSNAFSAGGGCREGKGTCGCNKNSGKL